MQSTAHLQEHPLHPVLIPYPFAFLSGAFAFDVAGRLKGRSDWSRTAEHLTTTGLVTAIVAAVPGVIDYFGTVPADGPLRRRATTHALCNVAALGCFAASARGRRPDASLSSLGMATSLLGTGLLAVAGWLGGELVYHGRVAVASDDHRAPERVEESGRNQRGTLLDPDSEEANRQALRELGVDDTPPRTAET